MANAPAVLSALLASNVGGLTFRRLLDSEFEWLRRLHREAMRPHVERALGWDEAAQRARMAARFSPASTLVVRLGGRDVGTVCLGDEDGALAVSQFYLAAGWRGLGIGSRVLGRVLAEADRLGRAVRLAVPKGSPARQLYERHGFAAVGADHWRDLMERPAARLALAA